MEVHMHKVIEAGLKIMRDPKTRQTTGTLRRDSHEGPYFCAMGCIAQAAVDAGLARWYFGDDAQLYLPIPVDAPEEVDNLFFVDVEEKHVAPAFEEALVDLAKHGLDYGWFIHENDALHKPLPVIAGLIEDAYRHEEAQ
jgi:hypothetical protein